MRYPVAIHESDEGFPVSVPGLPGCWSQGATEAEAIENIKDAIREYPRHRRKRHYLLFKKVKRRVYCALELCAKSGALQLVPRACFCRFFGCVIKYADSTHQPLPNRVRIRCFPWDTPFAVAVEWLPRSA